MVAFVARHNHILLVIFNVDTLSKRVSLQSVVTVVRQVGLGKSLLVLSAVLKIFFTTLFF